MLFLNHLTTLDPISCRIWCGRLFCGPLPLTIDINEPSLQIKHAKHDNFYSVHTNEISHLNIQVVNQASQKKHFMKQSMSQLIMEVIHDREGARSPSHTEGGARHRRSGGRLRRAQAPGTPPTPALVS